MLHNPSSPLLWPSIAAPRSSGSLSHLMKNLHDWFPTVWSPPITTRRRPLSPWPQSVGVLTHDGRLVFPLLHCHASRVEWDHPPLYLYCPTINGGAGNTTYCPSFIPAQQPMPAPLPYLLMPSAKQSPLFIPLIRQLISLHHPTIHPLCNPRTLTIPCSRKDEGDQFSVPGAFPPQQLPSIDNMA